MIEKLIEQHELIEVMQENEDSAIKVMKMYEECKKRIDKTIEYIEKHTYHDTPKKLQNGIYERGELIIKSDFYIDDLLEILKGEYIYE